MAIPTRPSYGIPKRKRQGCLLVGSYLLFKAFFYVFVLSFLFRISVKGDYRVISDGFPMLSYGFLRFPYMVFLWFAYCCSMVSLKVPSRFPMGLLWHSYGYPMVSYGLPIVVLWFSYGFLCFFLWFPMVFLWLSYCNFPCCLIGIREAISLSLGRHVPMLGRLCNGLSSPSML